MKPYFELFIYLQLLDFLTSLVGLSLGAQEANAFIRTLMQFDPALGLAASKVIALGLGAVCIWINRERIIRLVNYWFAGLVVWNLCVILVACQMRNGGG